MTPGSTTLGDYLTGLYGCLGVLMALRHRELTGEGQYVDAALYESVFRCTDESPGLQYVWPGPGAAWPDP